jgi:hypothetical protein
MKNTKLTRQGVRDLNSLVGKSKGRRIELPDSMLPPCPHTHMEEYRGEDHCVDCGASFPIKRSA